MYNTTKKRVSLYQQPKDFLKNCEIFTELILKYNKIHNITGAKNSKQIAENIEDSIFPLKFLKKDIKNAIDVGTGAGFPGFILAMYLPSVKFTLIEPIKKKSSFLHFAKSSLKLKNVDIISQRVEAVDAFEVDLICSRAVTKTDMLMDICKNFISLDTVLLFYKGSSVDEELSNIKNFEIRKNGHRNYLFLNNTSGVVK